MNPLLATFLRLTALVAVSLLVLLLVVKIALFVLPVVLVAAVVAALVLGGLFLYNRFRRRESAPVSRL